jgi:hypothetical protein
MGFLNYHMSPYIWSSQINTYQNLIHVLLNGWNIINLFIMLNIKIMIKCHLSLYNWLSQMNTCQNLFHNLFNGWDFINLLIMRNVWMHTLYEYKIYTYHMQLHVIYNLFKVIARIFSYMCHMSLNFNQQIIMDLNDQIWTLFSKLPILVIFCWIDIFSPLTCMLKSFLDG